MPFFEAAPIPAKKVKGIDNTSAQGHDITRKISALYINSLKVAAGIIKGGITAIINAKKTTIGV